MKTKRMTIAYWNTLQKGSKQRALTYVYPLMKSTVEAMATEKPDLSSFRWKRAFRAIRIPEDNKVYKTCVNQTFIP